MLESKWKISFHVERRLIFEAVGGSKVSGDDQEEWLHLRLVGQSSPRKESEFSLSCRRWKMILFCKKDNSWCIVASIVETSRLHMFSYILSFTKSNLMCHWIFTTPYNWLFFGCLKQWATFHPIIGICQYIYIYQAWDSPYVVLAYKTAGTENYRLMWTEFKLHLNS